MLYQTHVGTPLEYINWFEGKALNLQFYNICQLWCKSNVDSKIFKTILKWQNLFQTNSIRVYGFTTFYSTIPHTKLMNRLFIYTTVDSLTKMVIVIPTPRTNTLKLILKDVRVPDWQYLRSLQIVIKFSKSLLQFPWAYAHM
jgi:hypothetical protein